MRPNVFSFPPSSSFLDELAVRALKGELVKLADHALALGELTIYLPNRRLCRALTKVFIEKHNVTLLPRILPMGEDDLFEATGVLPPEMPAIERVLQLSKLIRAWGERVTRPVSLLESLTLAEELAGLLDRFITEDLPPDSLKTLDISHDHDEYWQISLEFLKIIVEHYPFDHSKLDASMRRNLILKAETARITTSDKPIIAAGSTGSIKSTRAFLGAVAHAKNGAVILPGLDNHLSRDDFSAIGDDAGHPQSGLKRLIEVIGVERLDGVSYPVLPRNEARDKLVSLALTPASRTHLWIGQPDIEHEAINDLTLIEAPDEGKEALALAIYIREKLEMPQTIAVVTPDRRLARRLKLELLRWNIEVDDTAGIPLSETQLAIYIRLFLSLHQFDPRKLMSFMAHEFSPWTKETVLLSIIDSKALRGANPHTFAKMKERLVDHPDCFSLLDSVEEMLKYPENASLSDWAKFLKGGLLNFSHENDDITAFLDELISDEGEALKLRTDEIELVLVKLMASKTLRPLQSMNLWVRVMGLPEARSVKADIVILAGLNEGVFPPQTETDPWLSRAMGAKLGLEPPERRISLAAHDFVQALGIENCVLSRSLKVEGNPTIASRWLQRLKAVLSPIQWQNLHEKGDIYVKYADNFERSAAFAPAPRPEPRPPLSARPQKLSVTEIEKLVRDPYAIYAKHILKVKPLDSYDVKPGGRDRGDLIHDIFKKYAKMRLENEQAPLSLLLEIGETAFLPYLHEPMIATFWVPRFKQLAKAFVEFDEEVRANTHKNHSELGGGVEFKLTSGRQFKLTTYADRIDIGGDGLLVFDYKTGFTPSEKQVKSFFSPQLPLTAMIAQMGGFKEIAADLPVKSFAYVKVTGAEEVIEPSFIKEAETLTLNTKSNLLELLNGFENEETPYLSKRNSFKQGDYGDYDHLARVDEWNMRDDE